MLGDDELSRGLAQVRDLKAGEAQEVPLGELASYLRRMPKVPFSKE